MTPTDWPTLISLAVHELRTPTSVINGYVRMLMGEKLGPLTEMQRKVLSEAEKSCARLSVLLGELSELSKFDGDSIPLQRQQVDIIDLVDAAARDVVARAEREVRVDIRGPAANAIVEGDLTRLRAAFTAIFHVVVREAVDSPTLLIEHHVHAEGVARAVVIAAAGDATAIRLLDAEPGRASLDEGRGGAGLGLPLARLVIEAHGGTAWSPSGKRQPAIGVRLPLK